MEGIVLLLISLIVGSVLKGKEKKNPPKKQSKPFTAQQQEEQHNPIGKLKEMYKEIQEELQGEAEKQRQGQQQMAEPKPNLATSRPPETAVPSRERRAETASRPSRLDRQTARKHQEEQQRKQQSSNTQENLMPKTEEDLIKGVIFSEIFGPPKSRR